MLAQARMPMLARGDGRRVLVRVSALHALVRDVRILLSADRWRPRLHAAAGPAGHRGGGAAVLAGPLHRRKHGAGHATRISPGPRWCSSAACTCSGGRSSDIRRRAHALRPGRGAGRLFGVGLPGALSGIRLSARRRDGRRHRRIVRAARPTIVDAAAAPDRAHHRERRELTEFPMPAYELAQIDRYLLGSIQFPAAARTNASSATSRRCTAASRDTRRRADLRRARQAGGLRAVHVGVFRRRQFHRQQARRARDAAAPDRMAEAQRLSVAAVMRGDAQHRQAAGNPRADARGGVHDDVLRHRDARSRGAEGDVARSTT